MSEVFRFTACPTCGATGTSIQRTSEEPVSRDPLAYRYLCTACDTVIEGRRVIRADDIDVSRITAANALNLDAAHARLDAAGADLAAAEEALQFYASTPTTIRVEDEAVVLTIDGAARLPAGTVITLTVTVGPGGALSVAPPAAVPAKRYMNGGRG